LPVPGQLWWLQQAGWGAWFVWINADAVEMEQLVRGMQARCIAFRITQ
jgi:hypothetical protein